ncbi:MAG: ATP-binding cassette domain-containing protein [Candidatus Saccharicenans sp.]|nr:ATP-binding cassette domain-containing protein [Candidatus Saccharicenans sp.]
MLWEVIKVTWKKIFRTNTISVIVISAFLLYCLYLIFVARSPEEGARNLQVLFAFLAVLLSGGLVYDEFESRQIDPFLTRLTISSLFWGKFMAVVLLIFLAYVLVGLSALASLAVNGELSSFTQLLRILGRGLVQVIYFSAAGFLLATRLKGVMNFAAILVIEIFALYFSEKYFEMLKFISSGGLEKFRLKTAVWLLLAPVWAQPTTWQMALLLVGAIGFVLWAFLVFRSRARKKNLLLAGPDEGQVRLRVSGLKMTYPEGLLRRRRKEALKGVDFSIKPGRLTGFLGPNGAGKTTTLRIILELLKPQAGRVEYFPARKDGVHCQKPRIGYLQETASLYPFLTVRETLYLVARNEGLPKHQASELTVSLAEKLQLGEHLDRSLKNLSKGTVQKVAFGVATIGQPEFLVFDEPYTGLDPLIMYEIRNLILELKEKGTTIFLSSHLLPEVEKICDEVILINRGKIVCSGEIEKLKTAWQLYQAARQSPALVERISTILNNDIRDKSFGYFAGLRLEPLLRDELVVAALKDVPVPDVEKMFLDSVMNP